MLKRVLSGVIALSIVATSALAIDGVRFNVAKGDKSEAHEKIVNEDIEEIGFILSDPHERINDGYKEKYGSTNLDNLGFFSVANDEALRELLIKEPKLGGFSPFNLHVYKKTGEDKTYVGHIDPETMLNIVGVEDKGVRKEFVTMFEPLDKMVDKEIGGKVEYVSYDALPKEPMMFFEYKFDRPEDLSEFVDEFQEEFEEAFEENKYIIAGYKNFREAYDDLELDFGKYDAYWVYSLCHFKFSESIFNQGRPDAGVFAPCSMYMYIEKDSDTLMIGMPKLENWIAVMGIKNKEKVKLIKDLDKDVVKIMNDLGAKSI